VLRREMKLRRRKLQRTMSLALLLTLTRSVMKYQWVVKSQSGVRQRRWTFLWLLAPRSKGVRPRWNSDRWVNCQCHHSHHCLTHRCQTRPRQAYHRQIHLGQGNF